MRIPNADDKKSEDEKILGRVVRKAVNANPVLKVNWSINFSSIKKILLCFCSRTGINFNVLEL